MTNVLDSDVHECKYSDGSILDLDLLQQRWLQTMDQEAPKESAVLEKHRCNGFNSLH